MADPWQECMDYAVTLARQAGEMIREALQNEVNVMFKSSPADLVTVTDQNIEKMLLSSIKEKYPSHSFIGEESVAAGEKTVFTDKPTWIIDPIDGTTNFVHRFPFVAVSIGFVVNKQRLPYLRIGCGVERGNITAHRELDHNSAQLEREWRIPLSGLLQRQGDFVKDSSTTYEEK
ncbi:inositol monophosphatase 1-like [Alexandromys fortis]|uniref:inositol monophosphatase 1-like n=1 Tax=Alexandromys fortis TaxID=100897 RepID=UPI002152B656|nr:inositol monophosphatase 1-like [Microtus fortis]